MSEEALTPPRGARKNFFQVSNVVIDQYGAQMGPYGIAVYAALALHADRDGYCYPAYKRLARLTGMGERTAIKAVQRLEALGLVRIEARYTASGDATSNGYHLPFHRLTKA